MKTKPKKPAASSCKKCKAKVEKNVLFCKECGPAQWLQDFYPVEARDTEKKDAIMHSLIKWIGLRPKTLAKYSLTTYNGDVYIPMDKDNEEILILSVSSTTCSLCFHYFSSNAKHACSTCPLFITLGRACDTYDTDCDQDTPPFQAFYHFSNPEPMIRLLRKTLKANA